jgi:hypothetical protein
MQAMLGAVAQNKTAAMWLKPGCRDTIGAWCLKFLKVPISVKRSKRVRGGSEANNMKYYPAVTLKIAVEIVCLKHEWLVPLVQGKWPEMFPDLARAVPIFRPRST